MVKYNQKRCEYSQKPLDHAKQSATDGFESAPKRAAQKTAETTGDLIGNKIANKIIKVLKNSPKIIQKQMKKKYMEKDIYLQN